MTTQHPADREPQTEALTAARETIAFLRSVVASGERLDDHDHNGINDTLRLIDEARLAARSASDTPRDGDEFAWLIERGQNRRQTPPIYWRSRGALPSYADEWTADPWQAARFSTRAAAEEAIHSLEVRREAIGDPVEHGFAAADHASSTDEGLRGEIAEHVPFDQPADLAAYYGTEPYRKCRKDGEPWPCLVRRLVGPTTGIESSWPIEWLNEDQFIEHARSVAWQEAAPVLNRAALRVTGERSDSGLDVEIETWHDVARIMPTFVQWIVQTYGPLTDGPVSEDDYERYRAEYARLTTDSQDGGKG